MNEKLRDKENNMKKYLLPENVLSALGQYLGAKPFNEVVQIVNALNNLEVHPEEQEGEEKKEDKKPSNKKA